MEIYNTIFIINLIIGIIVLYSFTHAFVICLKKLIGLTKYEKIVCWFAFAWFSLLILSILSN